MALRSHVKEFTINFNTLSITGSLYGIHDKSRERQYSSCSPEGKGVEQVYRDTEGNIWSRSDLWKRKKVGQDELGADIWEVFNPADIKAAKESDLPNNVATVDVYNPKEVDHQVCPADIQPYIVVPTGYGPLRPKEELDESNKNAYDILHAAVLDPRKVFMTRCKIRGNEGLYRLSLYQGYITLHKQYYPEELRQFPVYKSSLDSKVRKAAQEKVAQHIGTFDAEEYINLVARRLAQVEAGETQEFVQAEVPIVSAEEWLSAI